MLANVRVERDRKESCKKGTSYGSDESPPHSKVLSSYGKSQV